MVPAEIVPYMEKLLPVMTENPLLTQFVYDEINTMPEDSEYAMYELFTRLINHIEDEDEDSRRRYTLFPWYHAFMNNFLVLHHGQDALLEKYKNEIKRFDRQTFK